MFKANGPFRISKLAGSLESQIPMPVKITLYEKEDTMNDVPFLRPLSLQTVDCGTARFCLELLAPICLLINEFSWGKSLNSLYFISSSMR